MSPGIDLTDWGEELRELARQRRAEMPQPPMWTTRRPAHVITRIWQEREGEVSWSRSCGTVYKHQKFDGPAGVAVDLSACEVDR